MAVTEYDDPYCRSAFCHDVRVGSFRLWRCAYFRIWRMTAHEKAPACSVLHYFPVPRDIVTLFLGDIFLLSHKKIFQIQDRKCSFCKI